MSVKTTLTAGLLLLLSGLLYSCKNQPGKTAYEGIPPQDTTTPHLRLVWNGPARKVSHEVDYAEYGRIRRLNADTLLLIYHCGPRNRSWSNIALRKSYNNGRSWQPAQLVVRDSLPQRYDGFSTPDLLVLKNGWLALAYTGRGRPDDSLHNNIQVRISRDKGQSWSPAAIVSVGRSWEPGMVQLPDGEIELFFSTEFSGSRRSRGRPEQKIMLITSHDNGLSWSKGREIAFMKGGRDGMPVPVVLKGGKGVAVIMESVNSLKSPYVIWSSLKDRWNYPNLPFEDNDRRWWGATNKLWAGAPYIIQLPTGETIISVQDMGGRKIDRYNGWKKNTMLVMTGNSIAKNIVNITQPWPNLPVTEGAYFNSLFLKNDSTIWAVSTRNFADNHSEIWVKEGKVLRD